MHTHACTHIHTHTIVLYVIVFITVLFQSTLSFSVTLSNDEWVVILEQALLVLVIVGRWLLPKGSLTRTQLSSLLLMYLATASDIVDFFTIIAEDQVSRSRTFVCVILSMWTWSLMQFPFVVVTPTDGSRVRNVDKDELRPPCYQPIMSCVKKFALLMETDAWSILVSLLMQDGPYVLVRLTAILAYNVRTYSNYFFTAKNSFILVLNMYRFSVLICEYREMKHENESQDDESNFQDYVLMKQSKGQVIATM